MSGTIEYVELPVARAASGVRIVVPGFVPSPWSQATKGLFRLQGVPVLAVRSSRAPELAEWTRADNVPVVFHDADPPRTSWAAILALADRLGAPGALLPVDVAGRAHDTGWIHELAGEDGLMWSQRLLAIGVGLDSAGARSFALPTAQYLAARYGYAPDRCDHARARVVAILAALAAKLGEAQYFGGDRPRALDVYAATFLTPLCTVTERDCPRMSPTLIKAFESARESLAFEVPANLRAHRQHLLETHLGWPIDL